MAGLSNSVVTPGGVFSGSSGVVSGGAVGSTYVVSVSQQTENDDVIITVLNNSGTTEQIRVAAPGTGGGGDGTGGDPVEAFNLSGNDLTILLDSGASFTVDLSPIIPDIPADTNDFVTNGTLVGTDLVLNVQNQSDVSVDLSGLLGESDISTNGFTYTNTEGGVTLTISDNQVVLSGQVIPPVNPSPPSDPPPFNQIDGGMVEIDPPNVPSGTDVTNTIVNDIVATDNEGNDVSGTITETVNPDNSIDLDVPAGVDDIEVDVTYEGTDSNGDDVSIDGDIEIDSFVPFYTFDGAPATLTNSAVPSDAVESNAAIGSGTSFTITTSATRRRWLVAETSGLTFMNQGFPVAATQLSDTITIQNVTFYQYDFGVALAGTLAVTVN